MTISISRHHCQQMRDHVAACAPEEGCGLVAGREGLASSIYLIENELHSSSRFRMQDG